MTGPTADDATVNPTTPYAVSKVAGNMHLRALHKVRGFPMNILWPSNAYGSGQQLYRIIPRTILACLLDRRLPLQDGGRAVKSYIHAQDLAQAIYLTMHNAKAGSCYNVGPDKSIAIRDLVQLITTKLGRRFEDVVEIAPDRLGQDAQYLLNSSRIKSELGWAPRMSLDEGLDETIAWVKRYLDDLRDLSTDVTFQA